MKICEVEAYIKENFNGTEKLPHIWGIEIEEYGELDLDLDVADQVSIVATHDEDDETFLNDEVLDTVLEVTRSAPETEVILEVPYNSKIDPVTLATYGYNANFNISVIPPKGEVADSEEAWDEYAELVCQYVDPVFDLQMSKINIMPVLSYFEYMNIEHFGVIPENLASDPYMIDRFVNGVNVELMDKMKLKLKEKILSRFADEEAGLDGQQGFERHIATVIEASKQVIIERHNKNKQNCS